jgi:hypothetical protein
MWKEVDGFVEGFPAFHRMRAPVPVECDLVDEQISNRLNTCTLTLLLIKLALSILYMLGWMIETGRRQRFGLILSVVLIILLKHCLVLL